MTGRLRKYVPGPDAVVTAIQIDLDIDSFTYRKWGSEQRCSRGDWFVENGGDVYTITADTFARTYRMEGPGLYRKVAPVWARVADEDGVVKSEEGQTRYKKGDYIVFHQPKSKLGWAMGPAKFHKRYEPAGGD